MIIIKVKTAAPFSMRHLIDEDIEEEKKQQHAVPPSPAAPVSPSPYEIPLREKAPVQEPVAPVQEPVPSQPATPLPTFEPTPQESNADSQAVENLFQQAIAQMNLNPENGLQDSKLLSEKQVPIDIIEKILKVQVGNPKYQGQNIEEIMGKNLTIVLPDKSVEVPTHEQLIGYVEGIMKNILGMGRERKLRSGKGLLDLLLRYKIGTTDRNYDPTLGALKSKINSLEKEGIPLHIQDMFPMPSGARNKNMEAKIRAERLTEAYRGKEWEYGQPPVDENGEYIRAGDPGSRTYNSIQELNRVYNILRPSNPINVQPFQGGSNASSLFKEMKKIIDAAISKNEQDNGETQEKYNKLLPDDQKIDLDKNLWKKGGPFYVAEEMINPSRRSLDTHNFYNALMSGGGTFSYDVEREGDEGSQKMFEPSGKYVGYEESDEDLQGNRNKIKKIYDPLSLIMNPLVSTSQHEDIPMKKMFVAPNVANKVYRHMFPDMKNRGDLEKHIVALEDQLNKLLEEPEGVENERKLQSMDSEIEELKSIYGNPSIEDKDISKYYDYYKRKQTGIGKDLIEKVVSKIYDENKKEKVDLRERISPQYIKAFIEGNIIGDLSPEEAQKVSSNIDMLSQNINKVLTNYLKRDFFGKKNINTMVENKIQPLKEKYQKILQTPASPDEDFQTKSSRMEADIKSWLLTFMEDEIKGAVRPEDLEKLILQDKNKRNELIRNYTLHELDTGKVMMSHHNNLVLQRLNHIIMDLSRELLYPIYEEGKQSGSLTAQVLHRIRVALFLSNNNLIKIG